MSLLWFAPQASLRVSETISTVSTTATLESQQTFVSQATQDTLINVGKATVTAADDVTEVGQSFTADGPFISKVTAWAGKAGTPTDTIVCKIYTDSSDDPSTELIATSTGLDSDDLASTPAAEDFVFNEQDFSQPLKKGLKYWIVFDRTSTASDTNYYKIHYKGTASTVAGHALTRSDDDMASWTVDVNGYDLYHVIYAGDLPIVKDMRITGGERDVEALKLLGYNEIIDEKRSTIIEATFTLTYWGQAIGSVFKDGINTTAVTGSYYRTIGGEKSSNDRTTKCVQFLLTDGTNHITICMNDAIVTASPDDLAADGHVGQVITAKCLASNYYEEDDFA